MNRTIVVLIAAASVLAVGVVAVVMGFGSDADEAGSPSAPPPGSTTDPYDFDARTLDPDAVHADAEINLTCGQLLGENQVAEAMHGLIGHSELSRAEKYPDGYIVSCKFWTDIEYGNFLHVTYWNGRDTVAWCEEGHREVGNLAPDPAGPSDSYAYQSTDGFVEYQVCLSNKRLDIIGTAHVDQGYRATTIEDARQLASFWVSNLHLFDLAARTF